MKPRRFLGQWKLICIIILLSTSIAYTWASLGAQTVTNNPPAMWETWIDPWFGKIFWRRERLPTPVFLPGEFHGQRSQVGYSPWSCRVRHDWATSTSLHRICNTKIESEWKLWPLGGFLCQYRSITSKYLVKDVDNQGTTLVEDDDGEGGYAFVGTGVTWETSVPASQFYCETKTALKRGLIKK